MTKETILLLEDDPAIMKSNRGILEMNGYRILACASLKEARAALRDETPGLMILDVLLPDGKGTDFCREFRAEYGNGTPALFLTVMKESADIAAGYGAGGVDYIVKPFPMEHLLMKVDSLLESHRAAGAKIHIGSLLLNTISRRAFLCNKDLMLKQKEFSLLECLARSRDMYVSATELYERVWNMDSTGNTDTVIVHISKLRKKLGDGAPVCIESGQRSEGYRLIRKQE